ncbi:MAG: hypothetical protein QOH23_1972, partial [Gaiellaceae bacterium]|nr:hypothetical protein [Gaiellaceae bacterium]
GSSSDGVRVKPRAACASGMDYQFVMSASELGLGCLNLPATGGGDDQPRDDAAGSRQLKLGR